MKHTLHKDDAQSDRYLITYADVITLLLCLFVILYASSSVDAGKFREFSTAATAVLQGGTSQNTPPTQQNPQSITQLNSPPSAADTSFGTLGDKASRALTDEVRNGSVRVEQSGNGVKLLLAEELLFSSGNNELQAASLGTLDKLARVLLQGNYTIMVDGHTDCIPVSSFRFESNWHLSVARALAVGYYLQRQGVPERSMVIRGFGSQKPIIDNATPEHRNQNRRVEIYVQY